MTGVVRNKDALIAQMKVSAAEALFSVNFRRFRSPDGTPARAKDARHRTTEQHATGRREILRSASRYTLPGHVAPYIDLISGLSDFPPVRTSFCFSSSRSVGRKC